MRNTTLSLLAFLLVLTVSPITRAQDTKPAEQKSETSAATCVKAARESLFSTTKLEGAPVKVTGLLRYNFITQ